MKQNNYIYYGWLLKNGTIVPYEYEKGRLLRWVHTSYYKRGLKLFNLTQDFYISNLLERVS
jgi:hypothetical protein